MATNGILKDFIAEFYPKEKLSRIPNLIDFLLEENKGEILKEIALKKGNLDMFTEAVQSNIFSNTKFLEKLLKNTSEFIRIFASTKEKAVKIFKHPAVATAVAKNQTAVTEISTSYNALYGLVCNPTSARLFFESPHNNYERVAKTLGEPTEKERELIISKKDERQKAKTLKMWCTYAGEGYGSSTVHVRYETDGTIKTVRTLDARNEWSKSFEYNKVQFVTFENCTVDFTVFTVQAYAYYWELR